MQLGFFGTILLVASIISFLHYLFFRNSELRFLHTINAWICIGSFIIVLIFGILMAFCPITEHVSAKTEIMEEYKIVSVSIDPRDKPSGNTLIIEEDGIYYYYYVLDGEKEVRLGSVPVDNTTIIYSDGEPSYKLLRTIVKSKERLLFLRNESKKLYSSYILEVPRNSIKA